MNPSSRFHTGLVKAFVYLRILVHVPIHYARRPSCFRSPAAYFRFLWRALRLLLVFRHNKVVRVFNGYKLHLYLPAYPSPAFFYTIDSKLLRRPPGASTIVFAMTKACSYHCQHCYQRQDSARELDEERMLATARAVRDAGVAMFDIEGGEPFLRYPRLLKLVRALDERSEIWVNTTGAHLQPGQLEELQGSGLFGLMVSIHSPDPARHDQFTGVPGSFDAACRIVRQARGLGLVVALNSVLSEDEARAGGLDRLMELARQLDADFVQLIHPKRAGLWLGHTEGMQSGQDIIHQLQREHLRYNSARMRPYPALAAQVFEEAESVLGCTSGAVDRYYVGANGDVQPCEFLNLSFGNVHDEPFEVIYDRMRSYFRTPCCDWLCCTQAAAIQELAAKHGIKELPIPWTVTRELVDGWDRGRPTPIYRKLGIYE